MQKLFDDDDDVEETKLQINKNYARNYEKWRTKEEINKLKTKYGDHLKDSGDEDTSSSEDDEDAHLLTDEIDKQIFKTLAYLKKKDPKIYDANVEFFPPAKAEDADEGSSNQNDEKKKKKSEKNEKMTLRDYERKILVENGGIFSDDEDNEVKPKTKLPYVEEERQLLESIKNVANNIDENEDDDLLKKKSKTSAEKEEEEEAYKLWLLGQPAEVDDEDKKELKPLRDYWTDPNLDANEKFLRDYVMGNKFSELDDEADDSDEEDGYANRLHDDQDLSEDEKQIENQEEFEHKYNFRFEEPDPEFIKRYPRTISDSMRKKDTRRAEKRAEVKKRKEQEKLQEEEERKRYNALKRKEILDRLTRLRDVTGNKDINIEKYEKFLKEDYDPEEYDKLMQNDYGENYYNQDVDEDAKPEFPEIDEELEIEKSWDNYYPTEDNAQKDTSEPYCEDPDFVMDADYDVNKKAAEEITFKRKKRKRSKFAELLAKKKREYNPAEDGSFKDYIVKNYALDYEDKVGDNTFRFKYCQVTPNDYGLTVEEIMMADDKELNKWCSLKKALEYKDENAEQRLARIYKQKSLNENFKRKVLPSLYKPFEEEVDEEIKKKLGDEENADDEEKKKKRKRKKGKKNNEVSDGKNNQAVESKIVEVNGTDETNDKNTAKGEEEVKNKKKKKKKKKLVGVDDKAVVIEKMDEVMNEKKKKKKKGKESEAAKVNEEKVASEEINEAKGKKKRKADNLQNGESEIKEPKVKKIKNDSDGNINKIQKKEKKKKKKENENKQKPTTPHNPIASLSDERLKAYGLNPQNIDDKYKNCFKADTTLDKLEVPVRSQKEYCFSKKILFLWIVHLIFINSVRIIWWRYPLDLQSIILIAFVLQHAYHVNFLIDLMFFVTIKHMKVRFKNVNELLSDIFKQQINFTSISLADRKWAITRQMKYNPSSADILQSIKRIHLELGLLCDELVKIFQVPIVLTMITSFVVVIGLLMRLYLDIIDPKISVNEKVAIIIVLLSWFSIYVIKIFSINYICEETVEEWKKTGEIVHKIEIETKNPELRNELQQFSIQLIKNPLKFTPCGFFDLSYYFVRDFAGSMTAYLVLLIQTYSNDS